MEEKKKENESFERAIIDEIRLYGAPEHITERLIEYLINSQNIYTLIEIAKRHKIY